MVKSWVIQINLKKHALTLAFTVGHRETTTTNRKQKISLRTFSSQTHSAFNYLNYSSFHHVSLYSLCPLPPRWTLCV